MADQIWWNVSVVRTFCIYWVSVLGQNKLCPSSWMASWQMVTLSPLKSDIIGNAFGH